ncbi:methyltransferase [Streptomyces noboritoensis]|uniref:Ribosomal RNA large subunit methyltransferase G n=1 Tax=Streptomyces noboritoensis TaxID=67337 RepID=A0ABV6TSB6_9ACTN
MSTPWGEYDLTRFPEDPRDQLRAWDAADEYLLRHLEGTDLSGSVVALGDRWGALTTALAARGAGSLTQISESFLGQEATRANLARAGVAADSVTLLSTHDEPPARVDVLLVRVPKSLALLEDQLHRLAPGVHAGTVVVGTGMVKDIHTSTLNLFERLLGPTKTSLAEKKARLIFCEPDPALARPRNPWPLTYSLEMGIGPASGLAVTNYAGVFCADRLDIGTRFLLQHMPARTGPDRVVDLGCGNGIVGTAAALANPEAKVVFTDESHQAIASARATFRLCAGAAREADAEFRLGDGLSGFPPGSADLVLNNPPFHTHQATTDRTSTRMFTDAREALRPGGELWVVGNRHLGYHLKLERLFGNSELVASDPKFVVLRAVKR